MEGDSAPHEAEHKTVCNSHGLPVGPDGLCVLCRRVIRPPLHTVPVMPTLAVILAVVVLVLVV